jgi:hypothetical protein
VIWTNAMPSVTYCACQTFTIRVNLWVFPPFMLALTISIFLHRPNWKFCTVYKRYLLNSTGFNSFVFSFYRYFLCEMITNMAPVDEPLSINCNFFCDMPNWATYHLLGHFTCKYPVRFKFLAAVLMKFQEVWELNFSRYVNSCSLFGKEQCRDFQTYAFQKEHIFSFLSATKWKHPLQMYSEWVCPFLTFYDERLKVSNINPVFAAKSQPTLTR